MGRIEFTHEFIITGDLLGKEYLTQIGNVNVVVQMPIAEVSKEEFHVNLKSPYEWFEFDVGCDSRVTDPFTRIKTTHCFEWNEIAENIVECTLNVCLSIIAAFVFFIFQGYLQDKRRRMLYCVRIHGFIIVNILDNLRIIKKKLDKNELDIENTRMILLKGVYPITDFRWQVSSR